MNEKDLNKLLERKKSLPIRFPKNETEFAQDFFTKIEAAETRHNFHFWRYAAGFLVMLSLAAFFLLPQLKKECVYYNPYTKLTETARVFGLDTAVLFVNDELYTGERSGSTGEYQIILNLLQKNGKRIQLSLVCSDQDSIKLDMPGLSGEIVTSRCDEKNLILDLDIILNGKRIRLCAPVKQRTGNRYSGDGIV